MYRSKYQEVWLSVGLFRAVLVFLVLRFAVQGSTKLQLSIFNKLSTKGTFWVKVS